MNSGLCDMTEFEAVCLALANKRDVSSLDLLFKLHIPICNFPLNI